LDTTALIQHLETGLRGSHRVEAKGAASRALLDQENSNLVDSVGHVNRVNAKLRDAREVMQENDT
jgi:hypothetical protein